MAEHKIPTNISMTASVRAELIDLSKETGVPMNLLVERALGMLFAAKDKLREPEMVDVRLKLPRDVAKQLSAQLERGG